MKKSIIAIMLLSSSLFMMSCGNAVKNIPSGYVGKELTPTGYSDAILEAGQVDIGAVSNDETSTSLVLLEVTTTTIKESFMSSGTDSSEVGDHRVRTKDGTPLSVDIYVQISIPIDKKVRDGIFAMVTPKANGDRVSVISINDIYSQFAKMTIRGNVREIFAQYENADSVMQNYSKINAEISLMIINVVKQSKAPFEIMSAQLSNVKEDEVILASKNKLVAATNDGKAKVVAAQNEAQAIEIIGDAIRKNPQYLEARRLNVIEAVGSTDKASMIIMDTKGSSNISVQAPH